MLVVFEAMSGRGGAVVNDDVLYRFRLRLFSLAEELGNVRAACRLMGVHPSTYYRWRDPVLRSGLEMLRPRERRPPRMPNQASQLTEQRVIAFALGHPGLGPRRISATLAQERWGGIVVSPNGVWRVLRRHGLSRRISRLSLVAGYAAPPGPERLDPPVVRLSGTAGRVWQFTVIDPASSYVSAELAVTPLNPSARKTSALARRVVADLASVGWRLERVLCAIHARVPFGRVRRHGARPGATQAFIRAGPRSYQPTPAGPTCLRPAQRLGPHPPDGQRATSQAVRRRRR